jgi:DNA-binding IscR family transcriptional regulator
VPLPNNARKISMKDDSYAEQPAVVAVLKMLRSKRGATVAEIAKARKTEEHTIRSVMSRLRSRAGLKIKSTANPRRGNVFRAR